MADDTPIVISKRPIPQLQVRKCNSSEAVIIQYKKPFTWHKTLGHYKSPGDSNITQQMILEKNANEYAVKVQTSVHTHSKSQRYYDSCYLKSIGYILDQCFFKKKDSEKIERAALCSFVSKSGHSRNMAKETRETPLDL
eukprot:3827294-Ditylum_brightwellii.AAC.1